MNHYVKKIIISIPIVLFVTFLMTVPLIAFFPVMLAYPLIELFPSLGETGKHVEVGFAWSFLKAFMLGHLTHFILV